MALELAEWIELCRGTDVDDAIMGSMWGASSITPPPVAHPPITRLALTRARELAEASVAGASDAAEAGRLRREAIDWLGHPHPRASAKVRREMERLRAELEALEEPRDQGAQG